MLPGLRITVPRHVDPLPTLPGSALSESPVTHTPFLPCCFQPPIPDPNNMRDFVSYPSAGNERLHCTMKRTEDDPEVGGPCYTLYLEYLGGLVPILKGRRVSKLRPEFVIMDPRTDSKAGGPAPRGLQPRSRGFRTTRKENAWSWDVSPCGLAWDILQAAPVPKSSCG